MDQQSVVAICISPIAKGEMQYVDKVRAIAGAGLEGDRYGSGIGSFNKMKPGTRQVTFMNVRFFVGTQFSYHHSRRNVFTCGVELMWLIGREFQIGEARFHGVKYCDPCERPSRLSGIPDFKEVFLDCGGLIAEVIEGGLIKVNDLVIPPPKGY